MPVPVQNVDSKSKGKAQLDDFMEVMRPKKGPSWANEAKVSQPTIPVSEPVVEDVVMEEPAKTEAMSDLEWMKQRTSANVDKVEKVFEQSDDEKEPEIETKEVRLLRLASFPFKPVSSEPTRAQRNQRSNQRNYSSNLSTFCAQPRLLVHRCRAGRTFQALRGDFSGKR